MAEENKDILRSTIVERIKTLQASELTVKEQLGLVARELLEHYHEHADGTLTVKLLSVLSPMNKLTATLFFDAFIHIDEAGAKKGSKKKRELVDSARAEWLEGTQTFWEWAASEVTIERKPIDLKSELTKALKRAMNGVHTKDRDQEGLSKAQIAVIIMGEITVEEMMAALEVQPDSRMADVDVPVAIAA